MPPVTVAVKVTGMPTDGLMLAVKLATSVCGETTTVAEPEAVMALESVTVKDSVFEPLEGSVRLIVPVPV